MRWAVDTSVAVAGLVIGHVHETLAREAIDARQPKLPAHAAFEVFSVLTRLPGASLPPEMAAEAIRRTFGSGWLVLTANQQTALLAEFARLGIGGGRTYDGVVGATARVKGATLLTLDLRAIPTYQALGCAYELLLDRRR